MSRNHLKSFKSLFLRVRFKQVILLVSLFAIGPWAYAQIDAPRRGSRVIDDTTKQVYGPKTSRYFYEGAYCACFNVASNHRLLRLASRR